MNEINGTNFSYESIVMFLKNKIPQIFSFDYLVRFLILILPFHVILSVFLEYKIGLHGAGIYKEILLFVLTAYLGIYFLVKKQIPKLDIIDYSILGYFGYLILISFFNHTGLKAIIYGGRYDFEFLLIFLVIRHGRFLLNKKVGYYVKLFVISGSLALLVGLLVRFVFKETILIHFGFSPVLSTWNFIQGVPIYHGIEGANVRRFQGIFDGPNQAAFFLIFYASMLYNYWRYKKDYSFYLLVVLFIVGGLIFLTYSRSALLGVFGGLGLLMLFNLKLIIKKYRTQSLVVLIAIICLGGFFYIRYGGHLYEILFRAGSTKGHAERMVYGFNQFTQHPLGQGLASSGPGYRATYSLSAENEKFFIPESWYVQQLVEGGIIGFILFMMAMIFILIRIYPLCKPLFFAFFGVLVMNVVLHTFETSYVAILLFLFLGLFLGNKPKLLNNKVNVI